MGQKEVYCLRKSKRMYLFTKFEETKNDMNKTWQEINGVIGKSKKQPYQCKFKDDCGNTITDPKKFVINLTISL